LSLAKATVQEEQMANVEPLLIIGSGGHAEVLVDTVRASEEFKVAAVLDENPERWGAHVLGVPVMGLSLDVIARVGVHQAIIAVGANHDRQSIAERFSELLSWVSVVHPRAYVASNVVLGAGTVVYAGSIVQPGTRIGNHVILNTACSVDHGCCLGDYVHVAPGAHLAGDVVIDEGAFLGIGCSVLPGKRVCAWATVGGGAVVVNDIPAHLTAKGVPARFENHISDT
jgi:sugar O-acyltransferase (sialic acid O-acetyltransferase NeuD family)